MKLFKNNFPLHKLYGFLLLNTSLIVFTPVMLGVTGENDLGNLPIEMLIAFTLSLSGVVLSTLFILRKRIAIHLLTVLLISTILILSFYMIYILVDTSVDDLWATILIINAFGFFIIEGILGLFIIHSKKLSDEFNDYN